MRKLEQVPGQNYSRTIINCDFCGSIMASGEFCNACKRETCPSCSGRLKKLGVFSLCNDCMDEDLLEEYNKADKAHAETERAFDLTRPDFETQVAELKAMPEMQKAVSNKDERRIDELVKEYLSIQASLGRFQEREIARKNVNQAWNALERVKERIKSHVQRRQALCMPKSD